MFRIYFDLGEAHTDLIEIEVKAETIGEIETVALLECRKRLQSKFIMLHYVTDLMYVVYDGLAVIGKVSIRSL